MNRRQFLDVLIAGAVIVPSLPALASVSTEQKPSDEHLHKISCKIDREPARLVIDGERITDLVSISAEFDDFRELLLCITAFYNDDTYRFLVDIAGNGKPVRIEAVFPELNCIICDGLIKDIIINSRVGEIDRIMIKIGSIEPEFYVN